VTADATASEAAFRKARAGVVRTARAEIRRTDLRSRRVIRKLLDCRAKRDNPLRNRVRLDPETPEPFRNDERNLNGIELFVARDHERADLVGLTDDRRCSCPAIQGRLRLRLRQPFLFLDEQQFGLPASELGKSLALHWVHAA
jgi:hypothetical protein